MSRNRPLACALLAASSLAAPQLARAATTEREAALEARLERLEAEMQQLRTDLASAREAQASSDNRSEQALANASARDATTEARIAAVEKADKVSGFQVGATRFTLGGFVKVNAISSRWSEGDVGVGALGKEFYLPQQIPVGDAPSSHDMTIMARQTRFSLGAATPVGDKEIKGYLEFDFAIATAPAGAQRATNAYTPTLRRAFIQYGPWLIGQEWSTFQNVAILPESTDFAGSIEGTVFNRQPLVRYTHGLAPGLELALALENPQTEVLLGTSTGYADYDEDRLPDLVGRLNWAPSFGSFALAAIAREMRTEENGHSETALGWGLSGSGKILFGHGDRHDLRVMVTYGEGIGRYIGLGFVGDVVQTAAGYDLEPITNFAATGALRLAWGGTLRSTFMGGYQSAGYPAGYLVNDLANKRSWSAAGNLFWTPVSHFDVGVEYRHAVRETVSGADGALDRLEFAAKYSF
ncbi:porin [Novosphingobium profundi]|uniref:DcaP family trimeric outer membrane transporter n=1 Tax=Novosphingobium profundi TaxID=1774954 RepID=UPI001BDB21D2|nr:DcaP family trimeric outer membrane transporter [Novosphingobium profundi]MBT0668957.1 porin [Novosphingobium profundi]